jgi:hypothetical protein
MYLRLMKAWQPDETWNRLQNTHKHLNSRHLTYRWPPSQLQVVRFDVWGPAWALSLHTGNPVSPVSTACSGNLNHTVPDVWEIVPGDLGRHLQEQSSKHGVWVFAACSGDRGHRVPRVQRIGFESAFSCTRHRFTGGLAHGSKHHVRSRHCKHIRMLKPCVGELCRRHARNKSNEVGLVRGHARAAAVLESSSRIEHNDNEPAASGGVPGPELGSDPGSCKDPPAPPPPAPGEPSALCIPELWLCFQKHAHETKCLENVRSRN